MECFACQPGIARTDIFRKGDHNKTTSVVTDWAQFFTGQSAASGALSMVYCAVSPDLEGKGGTYYGPPYMVRWQAAYSLLLVFHMTCMLDVCYAASHESSL